MKRAPITLTAAEEALLTGLPEGEVANALRERGLPNRRVEQWKWSDIRAALREAREPSGEYADDIGSPALYVAAAQAVVFTNGRLRTAPGDIGAGLTLKVTDPSAAALPDSPIASLATAAPIHRIDARGEAALHLRYLSDGSGAHAVRTAINVAEGAHLTLIEEHAVHGTPFINQLTEIHLEPGSSVARILLQPAADDAVIVHTCRPVTEEDARFEQTSLCFGAGLARHETTLVLKGTADVRLDALYRLGAKRHNDFTTHVHHMAPGSTVSQLTKGIADDQSRAVFQGKFLVDRAAQKTDAQMSHHALLLSPTATANAKPELEIYADDVECAHGNTAGALDAEALFYLRQRGLDERAAQGLLIDAFGAEVLARVPDEALRTALEHEFRRAS